VATNIQLVGNELKLNVLFAFNKICEFEQFMKAFQGHEWSVQTYMALLLLPMIFLNWIRNLKYLAPFSMIANACMAAGLGIIFYYVFQDLPPIKREGIVLGFTSFKQLPLFFGTAIYAFEGIGMVSETLFFSIACGLNIFYLK